LTGSSFRIHFIIEYAFVSSDVFYNTVTVLCANANNIMLEIMPVSLYKKIVENIVQL